MGRVRTKKATGPGGRSSYKVTLDRATVAALRIMAAEETLASGSGCTSWVDLLRRGAAAVANGDLNTKGSR